MTARVFLSGTGVGQRKIAGMQTGLDILQIGTVVFQAGICLIQAVLIVWILTKLYGRRHDGIRGMAGSAVAAALLFIFWGVEQSGAVASFFCRSVVCHFRASGNLETETDRRACGYFAASAYICYDIQFCFGSADYDVSGNT